MGASAFLVLTRQRPHMDLLALRAVLASLGGCSPMPGQMSVQSQTDIDRGMAAVAQAGWFAFKGCPRKSMTPLLRKP